MTEAGNKLIAELVKIKNETELAAHFVAYFSKGYDVYSEVPAYGIIDIVATDGKIRIGIETKMRLNFDVIEQAYRNIPFVNYSYIAVPKGNRRNFAYDVCKIFGVGVLACDEYGRNIHEAVKPKFFRQSDKWYRRKMVLSNYMKESIAGSQNNRVTAFDVTVREICDYLKRNGGRAHIKDVLTKTQHHYANISSARSSIYKWVSSGIIKDFTIDGAHYCLDNQQQNSHDNRTE